MSRVAIAKWSHSRSGAVAWYHWPSPLAEKGLQIPRLGKSSCAKSKVQFLNADNFYTHTKSNDRNWIILSEDFFYFKTNFFSFYIPIPVPNPSPPLTSLPIHSSERVRLSLGSQQSLAYHFEEGPRTSPLYLGWARYHLSTENRLQKAFKHCG